MTAWTLTDSLRRGAERHGDRQAVVTPGGTLDYAELDAAADRAATALREQGVGPGDRVALVLPNGLEMVVAVFGVLRACAAIVPLNPTVKEHRLAEVIERARVAAVVCDADHEPVVRAATGTAGPAVLTALEPAAEAEPGTLPRPLDHDLAAVIFTSGSTGEPKGVMASHRNMSFVCDSIVDYLEMVPEDRILSVLPLSFGYGLYQLLTCVRAGATLILEVGLTFPGRVVQLLEDERVTGMPGVPTVWQVLIRLRGLAERELPHLRFLTNAGAALPGATLDALRDTFPGARLYSMYGQTECTRVCYLPPDQLDARPDSVGIAIPGTEVWVQAEGGGIAAVDQVGELIVRGPHVMQGYWDAPEATAERLRPGRWPWERVLATGDLFRRDADGYLYFVARSDDLIKSRGEKVAPREVEDVLHGVDGVREATVIGAPDELLGQAIHAHVALEPDVELAGADLLVSCAAELEIHKVPHRVIFHAALPRTANGKIDKTALAGSQ